MYQHRPLRLSLLGLTLLFFSEACTITEPLRTEPYEHGVIVLEAGQSGKGNASVSFISSDRGSVNSIFTTTNDRPLGDLLRSYTEIDGKGYLLVSNSDKVEVVENSTFRSIALVDKNVEQCRYMVAAPPQSGFYLKGYVSYWGGKTMAPGIAIVNLADRKVINHISVGPGPEQMVVVGDQLFVANSGGPDNGNTVSVINTITDQVVTTIPVGDVPTSVIYDPTAGLVNVLCSGKPSRLTAGGTTTAELARINPVTRQVVGHVSIGGHPVAGNPTNLVFNATSQTFYFLLKGAVYSFPAGATSIPVDKPLLNQSFTGLGVDPSTGIIYGGYSRDSTSKGVVRRFQPTGLRIDSVAVGYVPNGFYFK
ncbi:YncE family protein [uncultured Fibrella sp.]|uniref:YncE family protein n=1 Tax=uncultured Fibrella sp. TaxID=1284596 RepID=UPI0035CA2493